MCTYKFTTNFREERITGLKFAAHYREELTIIRKFATNFQEEGIILQKITWIETIGVTKLRRKISKILFQTKLPRKAKKNQEFCRK